MITTLKKSSQSKKMKMLCKLDPQIEKDMKRCKEYLAFGVKIVKMFKLNSIPHHKKTSAQMEKKMREWKEAQKLTTLLWKKCREIEVLANTLAEGL